MSFSSWKSGKAFAGFFARGLWYAGSRDFKPEARDFEGWYRRSFQILSVYPFPI